MQRVLVTGVTGFIGSGLARQLGDQGIQVIGVHKNPQSMITVQPDTVCCVDSDSLEACETVVAEYRPDAIVHLGGIVSGAQSHELIHPMMIAHVNTTVNWLSAAHRLSVKRVVVTGSMEEPREGEGGPQSPYALSKLAGRHYVDYFRSQGLVDAVQVGVAMGYGPGQRDQTKLVPHVINQLLAGIPPAISSAERMADWVYIDDITGALMQILFADELPQNRLEIGTGQLTSVRDIVNTLVTVADSRITPDFGAAANRTNEAERAANVEQMRALGWCAEVSLEEGLRRSYDAIAAARNQQ